MASLKGLINRAEIVDKPLFEYASEPDREALGKLQLAYLLAFEDAALTYIFHNPEAKREVVVPPGDLRFAVQLSATTYYYALETDPEARWLMVRQDSYFYVARLTSESLLWTWFFFNHHLTGTLDMFVFDAVILSPLSLGAEVLAGNTSSAVTTATRVGTQLQGKSLGAAYQTSSTVTRSLPSLVEEVVDYLLQQWYVLLASVKRDLMREVKKQMDDFEVVRLQTGRAAAKLAGLAEFTVNVTEQGAQKGAELVFEWSAAASAFNLDATLQEVR